MGWCPLHRLSSKSGHPQICQSRNWQLVEKSGCSRVTTQTTQKCFETESFNPFGLWILSIWRCVLLFTIFSLTIFTSIISLALVVFLGRHQTSTLKPLDQNNCILCSSHYPHLSNRKISAYIILLPTEKLHWALLKGIMVVLIIFHFFACTDINILIYVNHLTASCTNAKRTKGEIHCNSFI